MPDKGEFAWLQQTGNESATPPADQLQQEQDRQAIRQSGQDPFALAREAAGLPTPLERMIETTRQPLPPSVPGPSRRPVFGIWEWKDAPTPATPEQLRYFENHPARHSDWYRAFIGYGTAEAVSVLLRGAVGGVSALRGAFRDPGAFTSDPER